MYRLGRLDYERAVADPLNSEVMALLRSLPVNEVHVALGVPPRWIQCFNSSEREHAIEPELPFG